MPAAALNNAAWCDLFCRLHGMAGTFAEDAWTSDVRTPDAYPDAVTLTRGVDPRSLLSRIDTSAGASVKDSFADLDLAPAGFERLFEASWMAWSGAGEPSGAARFAWEPVATDADLRHWEVAWGRPAGGPRFFPPDLVDRDDVAVLAARRGGSIVAGAILSLGGGVVGVSNLFAPADVLADAFRAAAAVAGDRFPGLRIVGYQRGTTLDAALAAGFALLGPIVVWMTRER